MIICNKIFETIREIPRSICAGGEVVQYFINPQVDVWVITDEDENGKYLGTILLYLPLEKEEPIKVVLNLNDMEFFAGCFDVIQKEYPENAFEIQIPLAYEKSYFPYIVEQAKFIAMKTGTDKYASFYYVNGSKED